MEITNRELEEFRKSIRDDSTDIALAFKKWRKLQTAAIIVECPLSEVDAMHATIRAAGGKIVK